MNKAILKAQLEMARAKHDYLERTILPVSCSERDVQYRSEAERAILVKAYRDLVAANKTYLACK